MICFKSKTYDIYRESNHKFPITCERGNSNRIRLPQRVADSCHVLQSLIFMMLGHMGEAHRDGLPVQFMILYDFDISARMLQFYIQRGN